jgi:hypothetical protein
LALVIGAYFGTGYLVSRALEIRGLRKLLSEKTGKILDASAGYFPLRSHGLSVTSGGFMAKAFPPRALTEMRAARLRAHCNLNELWHGRWKIETLSVAHLQAAYGEDAALHLDRREFVDPELLPPSQKESPIKVDLRRLDVARLDLFWGTTAEAGGEFKDVHAQFFPRDHDLVVHAEGGTFRQAKFPAAQVRQVKLFFAKPDLRVDEAALTLDGKGAITVAGHIHFEAQQSFDLQLGFTQCAVAPFLSPQQQEQFEGELDGSAHIQKDQTQTESARAVGAIQISKAILQNIAALQKVAAFTGRKEIARMPIQKINGEYDWNSPTLTVRNFSLESNELVVLEGEFTMKNRNINGEFQLGVAPDVVEKFPGARDEVFKRSARGYLWTDLSLSGTLDNLRDNLKPRLLRAAQNHFARGLLAPIFKPGQNVIQAIEAL